MKKILLSLVGLLGLIVLVIVALVMNRRPRPDPAIDQFLADSGQLIAALQEFRKFVGHFPEGPSSEIANALTGQNSAEPKVVLLADSLKKRNAQGELLDPWGTPLQVFFGPNHVMIRSAGPNRIPEDDSVAGSDDLFRTDAR